jgi:rod shape-determining protein MreD
VKWYLLIIVAFVFVALEVAFPTHWQLGYSHPELALILAVYLVLNAEAHETLYAAWIVGFTKDVFSTGRLGTHSLIYVCGAAVLLRLRSYLYRDEVLVQALVVFAAVFLADIAYVLQLSLTVPGIELREHLQQVLVVSLYSAACAPVIFLCLDALRRPLGAYQRRHLH